MVKPSLQLDQILFCRNPSLGKYIEMRANRNLTFI